MLIILYSGVELSLALGLGVFYNRMEEKKKISWVSESGSQKIDTLCQSFISTGLEASVLRICLQSQLFFECLGLQLFECVWHHTELDEGETLI